MTKRKPGRPEKSDADARSERIAFRVTLAERMQIEAAAIASDATVSDYARAVVLTTKPPKARTRSQIEAAAISELNRVGVNLWQITKHLNFGGSVPADLHEAISDVRAAVARLAGDAE